MMVVVTVLARLKAAPTTESCSFSLAGMARSYHSAFVSYSALHLNECARGTPQRTMVFLIRRAWMPDECAATGTILSGTKLNSRRLARRAKGRMPGVSARACGQKNRVSKDKRATKREAGRLCAPAQSAFPPSMAVRSKRPTCVRGKTPQRGHRAGRQPKKPARPAATKQTSYRG